jgi:hypothetical protein
MAKLYHPGGAVDEVYPADGYSFSLGEFRALLATDTLDFVYLEHGRAMVVDDLGDRKDLPYNKIASTLYMASGGTTPIVGRALYCRLLNPGLDEERWL